MKLAIRVLLFFAAAMPAVTQQQPQPTANRQRATALQLEQRGEIPEAEAAWSDISKASPRNPEPYAHLALLKARQQKYKEAVPLYRKALALDPNVRAVRLNLALALFKDEQFKAAITEFRILRRQATRDSAEAQRLDTLLGMSYYGLGEYQSAVPFLKAASQRDKQNLPLLLSLAHSCLWSKQFPCVMDTYHQILSLNAESAEADMLAGEALDEMQDTAGAIKMFRAAVAANPKEPNVHFGLGYLLWAQKQYPEALQEFQAELENDPNHAQSLVYLGDCHVQLNNPAAAVAPLKKGVSLDPSLWLAHLDLGIIDSDAGRNEDALRELRQAAKLKPQDVNVHWRLGRLLRTLGRKQESQQEFEAAKKLNKAADEDLYKKIANGANRNRSVPQMAGPER